MKEEKVLLKLGGRKHLGEARWKGALEIFDRVECVCTFREHKWDIPSDKVHIIQVKHDKLNQYMIGFMLRTAKHRSLDYLTWLTVHFFRAINAKWLKQIKGIKADKVLCSYGDYDMSYLVFVLAKCVVKGEIVRSSKETRVGYDFFEYQTLKAADKVVMYDEELKKFYEGKYGEDFFRNKKIVIGPDENALPSCMLNGIQHREKLSSIDQKTHVAILTFRVDSTETRERDQSRYYYVGVIEKMIQAGLIVHLHCAVYNNDNGINRYEELQNKYPGLFFMEPALDMKHNSTSEEWIRSCEVLSQYDAGLMHNITDTSSVSVFDRINVPHRLFAYEAAHVVPFIEKGENIVLEKMFIDMKCGFVYEKYEDLTNIHNLTFDFYCPTYEDYLRSVLEL